MRGAAIYHPPPAPRLHCASFEVQLEPPSSCSPPERGTKRGPLKPKLTPAPPSAGHRARTRASPTTLWPQEDVAFSTQASLGPALALHAAGTRGAAERAGGGWGGAVTGSDRGEGRTLPILSLRVQVRIWSNSRV